MKNSVILTGIVACILVGSTVSYSTPTIFTGTTGADSASPPTAQDLGRSLTGFVTNIINLCGDGESKAQLIATQEENNQNTSGASGSCSSTDTSSGSLDLGSGGNSEFSGSTFNYINTQLLGKEGNVGYAPLKKILSSSMDINSIRKDIRTKVLEEFFADTTQDEQKTTKYQEKIRKNRNKYVQEAAGRHITLGARVKGYIQNDLSVISSVPLSGDGEIGAIAVDAHTLEQIVKMELVDLALQIEMMEADAIQFMMHQPVILMSETKQ